jgi:hypothetical protein
MYFIRKSNAGNKLQSVCYVPFQTGVVHRPVRVGCAALCRRRCNVMMWCDKRRSKRHCAVNHRLAHDLPILQSKAVPLHATKVLWGRGHSSYSFSTAALDGGEWLASRPDRALAPGKGPPVPILQEAGWAPEPVWTQRLEETSLSLQGIKPRSPGRPVRDLPVLLDRTLLHNRDVKFRSFHI